jgi:hypothetical protein
MPRKSSRLIALLCIVAIAFMAFALIDAAALPANLAPRWLFLLVLSPFIGRAGGRPWKIVRPALLILLPRPPPAG